MRNRGFTLIETVIVMLIVAIIVPTVMIGLNTLVVQSNKAEKITIATDLARYYMELALSKRFDERIPPLGEAEATTITLWKAQASFGPDTGAPSPPNLNGPAEVAGDMTTYDDVDDFVGTTNWAIPGFTGYTLTMAVTYVTVNADGTWNSTDSAGGAITNAKRIRVTVTNSLIGNVTLDCVTGALY